MVGADCDAAKAGWRRGAGLPRRLPRAGRLPQRLCRRAETLKRCAHRLRCGFPGATYLPAKIMQASGKRACPQFPECSLSSAKIQHFITLAKCLGVFRSATSKRPAPTAPSATLGGKRTMPLRSHGPGRRRGARFVKFSPDVPQAAQPPVSQHIAKQGVLLRQTARSGLQYRPFGRRERAAARNRQAAAGAQGAACTVFSQAQPQRQACRHGTLRQNILPLRPFSLSLHRRQARAESLPARHRNN